MKTLTMSLPGGVTNLSSEGIMNSMQTPLDYIEKRLKKKKYTQTEVGRLTRDLPEDERISQSYMSNIRNGVTLLEKMPKARLETLRRILDQKMGASPRIHPWGEPVAPPCGALPLGVNNDA
jgi:hypothetical protein